MIVGYQIRLLSGLVVLSLLLAGCSSYRLAYNNIDRILISYIDDYVDLDDDQRQQLQTSIDRWQLQHRQQQLPIYRDQLLRLRQQLSSPPANSTAVDRAVVDTEMVEDWLLQVEQNWQQLRLSWLGPMQSLLSQLQLAQQQRLLQQLRKRLQQQRDEYQQRTPSEQQSHRYTQYRKRLQRWSGPLDQDQQQQLKALVPQLDDNRPQWFDYRARWIDQLELLLAQERDAASVETNLQTLVMQLQRWQSEQLRQSRAANRKLWVVYMRDFINGLSTTQRNHLVSELDDLIDDAGQLMRK
ncbi:MAG: DUF6279 family lipoprotein [Motiliproteus sp.]